MVGRLVRRLVGRLVRRLVGRLVEMLVGWLVGRLVGRWVGRVEMVKPLLRWLINLERHLSPNIIWNYGV